MPPTHFDRTCMLVNIYACWISFSKLNWFSHLQVIFCEILFVFNMRFWQKKIKNVNMTISAVDTVLVWPSPIIMYCMNKLSQRGKMTIYQRLLCKYTLTQFYMNSSPSKVHRILNQCELPKKSKLCFYSSIHNITMQVRRLKLYLSAIFDDQYTWSLTWFTLLSNYLVGSLGAILQPWTVIT